MSDASSTGNSLCSGSANPRAFSWTYRLSCKLLERARPNFADRTGVCCSDAYNVEQIVELLMILLFANSNTTSCLSSPNWKLRNQEQPNPRSIGHADPMEFSEGYTSMAALYSYALKTAGVKAAFEALHPLSPRVLGFPTILSDAVLHSFSSESLQNQQVDLHDNLTGARLKFELPAQRGAALLLRRSDGAVLAAYGSAERRQSRLLTALSNSRLGIPSWSEASNNTSGPAELVRRMPQWWVETNFCLVNRIV